MVGNSGAQGINLAYRWGAKRIVLVGFDMCRRGDREHWFGDHPKGLITRSNFGAFVKGMGKMAIDLRLEDIEVINTCAWSALPYWPKTPLEALR